MEFVNYFAYGANMRSSVLQGARGIKVIDYSPATLPNYKLIFNCPGVHKYEPSFANVEAEEGASVEGVLYQLAHEAYEDVVKTEGRLYRGISVQAIVGDEIFDAVTLVCKVTIEETKPSKRYLKHLLAGAREKLLPSDYIYALEQVGHAPAPPGYDVLSYLVNRYIKLRFWLQKRK